MKFLVGVITDRVDSALTAFIRKVITAVSICPMIPIHCIQN